MLRVEILWVDSTMVEHVVMRKLPHANFFCLISLWLSSSGLAWPKANSPFLHIIPPVLIPHHLVQKEYIGKGHLVCWIHHHWLDPTTEGLQTALAASYTIARQGQAHSKKTWCLSPFIKTVPVSIVTSWYTNILLKIQVSHLCGTKSTTQAAFQTRIYLQLLIQNGIVD